MSTSKTKKAIKGQKQKPMNDFEFQAIMNEYCVSPFMYMEDSAIRECVANNDEIGLRKILQYSY